MKNYIVAWVPLAWKSTLSNHLHTTYKMNHIPVDWFVTAFEETFPNIWIKHSFWLKKSWYNTVCNKMTDFALSFINELEDQNIYSKYVIEWCHRNMKQLNQYKETHEIIVLWYPSASVQEQHNLVRKKDKNNRTNEISEEELKNIINFRIDISNDLQKQSIEYWYKFLDTAKEHEKLFLL